MLLRTSRITAEKITITAARPDLDNIVVASASARTVVLPQPRVALELRGHGKIDFVPTNRPAAISVSSAGEPGIFVPIAVPGVYGVVTDGGTPAIRSEEGAEGFASMRLAYR